MEWIDCVSVSQTEDVEVNFENWTYNNDPVAVNKVTDVVGLYWKLAQKFQGPPVYRSECGIFLFYCPAFKGWVWSRELENITDAEVIAWGPIPPNKGTFPSAIHLPHWCKKQSDLATVLCIQFYVMIWIYLEFVVVY